jgi:signal transduction histidine kinase/CheY-like chemotaxis protein
MVCAQSKSPEQVAITALIDSASVQYQSGKYVLSLQIAREALLKSLTLGDERLIAYSYNSIGVIYNEFANSKHALEFYQKALVYAEKTDDLQLKNWIYGNLGSIYYYDFKDYHKGILFYKKSLAFAEKTDNKLQICYTKLNIAGLYLAIYKNENASIYLQDVKLLLDKLNNFDVEMQYLENLGTYYFQTNKLELAEQNLVKAFKMASSENATFNIIDICLDLRLLYDKNKNFEKKAFYNSKIKENQKIIDKQKILSKLDDNTVQIELDINKIKLDKIELLYKQQIASVRNSQIIYGLFVTIIIGLVVFAIVLFCSYKNSKIANKLLETANQQLILLRNKAEENANLKAQFVSTISHELRTPLYGVIGIVDLFSEPNAVNDGYRDHLKSLKFSARYLLGLVNNILQVSKIDNRQMILENKTFNLRDELEVIKSSLQYLQDSNSNSFDICVANIVPQNIFGDSIKLSQILMNLCSNALKFTTNGNVTVFIDLTSRTDDKLILLFKIIDNGIGIPLEFHDLIFDKFVQVERNNSSYQGTGLGLTIVKNLLKLFESQIRVESSPDQGTTFFFEIAFEEKIIASNIKDDKVTREPQKQLEILVVEDNIISKMLTCKVINNAAHKAISVDNGFDAIELVNKNNYDFILLDLNMPKIDGFETAQKIRETNKTIPIIALTASDVATVKQKIRDSSIDDIVEKPFEKAQLLKIIKKHLISDLHLR